MKARRLLAGIALIGVGLGSGAEAHTSTFEDPQDTDSPFDIRSVSLTHDGTNLKGKVVTYQTYPKSELVPKGNTFYLDLDTDQDTKLDFYISMFAKSSGELTARVYKRKEGVDPLQGNATLSKTTSDGGTQLTVTVKRSLVGVGADDASIRHRWFSQYNKDTYDDVPASGWIDLKI